MSALQPARQVELPPDAFPGGMGQIPSNPMVRAFLEAISKGGPRARHIQNGWTPNSNGNPFYIHNAKTASGKDERIKVYLSIPRDADEPPATMQDEWEMVERFGAWTADVTLSCLSQVCERKSIDSLFYSPGAAPGCVIITAETVLRNKEIRRRGVQRRHLYPHIGAEIESLRALKCDARWRVPRTVDGKEIYDIKKWKDQLFDIATYEHWQQGTLYDSGADEPVFVAWSLRLGQWAQYWFTHQDPWIVNCAQILMTLDHRGNRASQYMAKKIGLYFTLIRKAHEKTITPFVGTILEAIGELPTATDHHSAGRTRDRVDEAISILIEKHFFKWEWVDGRDDNEDRAKGWPDRWLNRKACVTLLVSSEARPIEKPKFGQSRNDNQDIVAAEVRHIRIEQHLTQGELARRLGITQSLLSRVERGERAATGILEKLRGLPGLANPPARLDL